MKKEYLRLNSMEYLRYLFTKKVMEFSIQNSITASLDRAMKKSLMINLQQREGNGKSTGLASYIIGRPNCYYMKIGPSYSTHAILEEMAFLICGESVKSFVNNWELVKKISKFLIETDDKKLICIDDCTFLTFRQLSHFQELRDWSIQTTSFVFIAPPEFEARLVKAKNKGQSGAGEFFRRFQGFITLPGLTPGDVKKYCAIKKLNAKQTAFIIESEVKTIAELENKVEQILELDGL